MLGDDRRLVNRCIQGDSSAFDALYHRYAGRIYSLLRRLTGSEPLAEDLTQETFLAAYRGLRTWRGEGRISTWLCGIAYRLYANYRLRTAGHETEPLDEDCEIEAP